MTQRQQKGRSADGRTLTFTDRPATGPTVRLAAVGDVATSGRVAQHFTEGADGSGMAVLQELKTADLMFANLECVVRGGDATEPFAVTAGSLSGLHDAGFTVLNLANNHVLDRGVEGLEATVRAVEATGMTVIGVTGGATEDIGLVITDLNGLRIGWLGAARTLIAQPPSGPRIWELDEGELTAVIRRARSEVDVIIVSLHTGYMLVEYPAPEIRQMALRLAAAGADLILMHHPHVLQGVEVTAQGRVICYSLGNFLFDWQEGEIQVPIVEDLQRQGGIFTFELDRNGVASAVFQPTVLDDECRVVRPGADFAAEICDRVGLLSHQLSEGYEAEFDRQRAERNTALGFQTLVSLAKNGRFGELIRHLGRLRPGHFAMAWRWLWSGSPKRTGT